MDDMLIPLFFVCAVCGILGYVLGSSKGQGGLGAILGILLGPLGLLIAVLLSDQRGGGR